MEKETVDKVLFELDNIMYGDGCKVLAAHTRLPDGTLLPGRRYQTLLGTSWHVRPCPSKEDVWEVAMYPSVPRRWSKKVILADTKEERTVFRKVPKLLRAMCRLAEEAVAEA